jgi:hypothetical protein
MRDKGIILTGLVIFLALATFPIWFNLIIGKAGPPPELKLPAEGGQCVADTQFMRTHHMDLLMDWRDEVVRDNDRIYETDDGRRYYKSLSGTCMSCHTDKKQFCDACHNYTAVTPYCWDCHVDPTGEK